jgi:hypothetical protein
VFHYNLDLGMTAGKVQSTGGLPTSAVSGTAEPGKTQGLGGGDKIPRIPPVTGSSASDGPGIIHCKEGKVCISGL